MMTSECWRHRHRGKRFHLCNFSTRKISAKYEYRNLRFSRISCVLNTHTTKLIFSFSLSLVFSHLLLSLCALQECIETSYNYVLAIRKTKGNKITKSITITTVLCIEVEMKRILYSLSTSKTAVTVQAVVVL